MFTGADSSWMLEGSIDFHTTLVCARAHLKSFFLKHIFNYKNAHPPPSHIITNEAQLKLYKQKNLKKKKLTKRTEMAKKN